MRVREGRAARVRGYSYACACVVWVFSFTSVPLEREAVMGSASQERHAISRRTTDTRSNPYDAEFVFRVALTRGI